MGLIIATPMSPDGRYKFIYHDPILTESGMVVDLTTGKRICFAKDHVVFSPDSKMFVTLAADLQSINVFSLPSGDVVAKAKLPESPIGLWSHPDAWIGDRIHMQAARPPDINQASSRHEYQNWSFKFDGSELSGMQIELAETSWHDLSGNYSLFHSHQHAVERTLVYRPTMSILEARWNEFISWFLPKNLSEKLIVSKPPLQSEWCLRSAATGEALHRPINLGWTMKGTVLTHDHRWLVHGSGKMLRAWRVPPPVPWLWALLAASIPWLILFAFRTYRRKRVRRANAGD